MTVDDRVAAVGWNDPPENVGSEPLDRTVFSPSLEIR